MVFFKFLFLNNSMSESNDSESDYNVKIISNKKGNSDLLEDHYLKKNNLYKLSVQNEKTQYLNSDANSFINSSEYAEDIDNL